MTMMLGTQTITRLRASETTDAYGNTVRDWSNPTSLEIAGCSVQPGLGSLGTFADRAPLTFSLTVWLPADADVADRDRVLYGGRTYVLVGPVQVWDVGALDHKVLTLEEVDE